MHGVEAADAAAAVSEEQTATDGASINIEDDVVDTDYEVIDDTD